MDTGTEWSIVIIDDEPDIRDVMTIVLADDGFRVHPAEDGKRGLELVHRFHPQIVITDIRMPGLDGLQVLENVKSFHDDIQVIVITAFGDFDLAIRALQLDASDFITKPLNEGTLKLALRRAMERYTSRRKLKEYAVFLEQENITQAKLMHKDKLVSLGQLAASVVHEINNPISGVLNYARLMNRILKTGPLSPERLEKFARYLELIETESSRVSEIISSLLTFSRKSDPKISRISIPVLVEKSVLLCRHRLELQRIHLEVTVETDLPEIQGDFNQLQQCLINLLFNSADAMPHGGSVVLSAGMEKANDSVVIRVEDTGSGIRDEIMKKIFDPFFTTKHEGYGVGLGLSILFGIMEGHGGHVDVSSTVGKGTSFTLTFPVPSAMSGKKQRTGAVETATSRE